MCTALRQMQVPVTHGEELQVSSRSQHPEQAEHEMCSWQTWNPPFPLWSPLISVPFPMVLQDDSMSCALLYLFYWWRNKALKRPGPQKKKAICKFSWKTVLDFMDSVLASFYLPYVHTLGMVLPEVLWFWNPWRTAPHTVFLSGKKGWVV